MQGLLALPLVRRLSVLLSVCVWGVGSGSLDRGAGAAQAPTLPQRRFPRRGRTQLAPHQPFLFQSLWRSRAREGRPRRRPPAVGPGRAGPGTAGTAPASDRLGWSWGRGRMGVGVQTRVSVPRRGLAERLLNLDF